MPNLSDYIIENRAMRERVIAGMVPFMIVGCTISSACMWLARYYR